jgi:hypothetical protein
VSDRRAVLEERLVALRTSFDAAFTLPADPPVKERRGYLGIRLRDAPYALDLDEVASVRKHVPVTPLPSEESSLLGVAGFGGVLTAVYDLGGLLGQALGAEPAWFVLVRGAPVAFALDGLEGQLRAEAAAEGASREGDGAGSDLDFRAGLARPVIRLHALVARLRSGAEDGGTKGAATR